MVFPELGTGSRYLISPLLIKLMGLCTTSASLQKIQNWEEWGSLQMIVPPFTGTLTGWKNGHRRTSSSSKEEQSHVPV